MHALIIEDESLIAMAIEDALRDCGFTSFDFAARPTRPLLRPPANVPTSLPQTSN